MPHSICDSWVTIQGCTSLSTLENISTRIKNPINSFILVDTVETFEQNAHKRALFRLNFRNGGINSKVWVSAECFQNGHQQSDFLVVFHR